MTSISLRKMFSKLVCVLMFLFVTIAGSNAGIWDIIRKAMSAPRQPHAVIGPPDALHMQVLPNGWSKEYTEDDAKEQKRDIETLGRMGFTHGQIAVNLQHKKAKSPHDFMRNWLRRDPEGRIMKSEMETPWGKAIAQYKICNAENKIIGFFQADLKECLMDENTNNWAKLSVITLFLDPRYQGNGYGRETVRSFIDFCETNKDHGEIVQYGFVVNDSNRESMGMMAHLVRDLGDKYELKDNIQKCENRTFHIYILQKVRD